ncbi:MAG: FecR domain-containing protein [Cyclobacteriaceae bacterium]
MEENFEDIDHLILVFLRGEASEKQYHALKSWSHSSDENKLTFESIEKIWLGNPSLPASNLNTTKRDQIWARATQNQTTKRNLIKSYPTNIGWWMVAAILFLIFSGVWLATLMEKNTKVPENISWINKTNPGGQQSTHLLPDGTKVWLNAQSVLKYPDIFSDSVRLVKIHGEAYFEVAKDAEKPFLVLSDGVLVEALGTSFNVRNYPEDLAISVSLLEGKVMVSEISQGQSAFLIPGEGLDIPRGKSQFFRKKYDYDTSFGWKDGILIFNGNDFTGFRQLIQRWYGVNIHINGAPPSDWSIRARYKNESLRHVLRDICFNKNIEFELTDTNAVLTF